MRLEVKDNPNPNEPINAEALINANKKKLSLWKKIWFWLTCWRPITKYELARREQAWLRVGVAVLNNYNTIQRMITNVNNVIMTLHKAGLIKPTGGEQPFNPDVVKQEDEKKDDEKKGDVMYG